MRRTDWIPISIAALGSAVLIYWLVVARPLWVDEEMLALNVRDRTLAELAGPLWLNQSAPYGWLVLERLLMRGFGQSERAVRLLPVLFGIATLSAAAWIARRWMSAFGGAVFVLMCAFGEWIVFFTLELKHYSADTFWALLLPALAVWALEDRHGRYDFNRRAAAWWVAATVGMWFGNGAVFVAPGCAVALLVASWRRDGWRGAMTSLVPAVLWGGSFAANYAIVLRHALVNPVLREYWAFAFPSVSNGVFATARWFADALQPFADKPGSSGMPLLFWTAWAIGIGLASARRQALGVMFATVPLSAVALAVFHIVPIFERLALWVVPPLYVAVGLCADAARWLATRRRSHRSIGVSAGVLAGAIALVVAADVVWRGAEALARKPRSNYGLDDRNSVRFLLAAHRPGDAIATTHFGLVALWWYGGLNISDVERTGALPDGSPVFELRHVPRERDCARANAGMDAALEGVARIAIYLGFRLNVLPAGFDKLVLRDMAMRGSLVSYKEYADESKIAVYELGAATPPEPLASLPGGCVAMARARRW